MFPKFVTEVASVAVPETGIADFVLELYILFKNRTFQILDCSLEEFMIHLQYAIELENPHVPANGQIATHQSHSTRVLSIISSFQHSVQTKITFVAVFAEAQAFLPMKLEFDVKRVSRQELFPRKLTLYKPLQSCQAASPNILQPTRFDAPLAASLPKILQLFNEVVYEPARNQNKLLKNTSVLPSPDEVQKRLLSVVLLERYQEFSPTLLLRVSPIYPFIKML